MAAYGPADFARDFHVSRETLAALEAYAALLEKWNRKINLVGRETLADLWRRHFLDSIRRCDPSRELSLLFQRVRGDQCSQR